MYAGLDDMLDSLSARALLVHFTRAIKRRFGLNQVFGKTLETVVRWDKHFNQLIITCHLFYAAEMFKMQKVYIYALVQASYYMRLVSARALR